MLQAVPPFEVEREERVGLRNLNGDCIHICLLYASLMVHPDFPLDTHTITWGGSLNEELLRLGQSVGIVVREFS